MILIIGPAFSGKREYALRILRREEDQCPEKASSANLLTEVQELVSEDMDEGQLRALADSLCERGRILTASETGAGIVPVSYRERRIREMQGRLLCELSGRADIVIRVFYGIPEVLKGERMV